MILAATFMSACGGGGGGGDGGTPAEIESHNLTFAKRAGGISGEYGAAIATHSDGSFVATGRFPETAVFGEGEINETTLTSVGEFDVFVAGFNADGTLAFAKQAGGAGRDLGAGVAICADGSFVVTGEFRETATFGAGESNETMLTSEGDADMFVAHYEADGTLDFARRAGGSSFDQSHSVAVLADGSFVITGNFDDTATFGAGEVNETILVSENSVVDIFVARYGSDGALMFAKRAGGNAFDRGIAIATNEDGSFVVTGAFQNTATFGTGETQETVLISDGGEEMFAARYNADGTLAFVIRARGIGRERGVDIATHADGSFVVLTYSNDVTIFGEGEVNETTLAAPVGAADMIIASYNADGTLAFVKRAAGEGAGYVNGFGIAIHTDGSFVVTGSFWDTAMFGAGEANQTKLITEGQSDIFVALYNADGSLAFAKQAGGIEQDDAYGVAMNTDGSFVITGFIEIEATFDAGEISETTLTVDGDIDVFVARYDPDGES